LNFSLQELEEVLEGRTRLLVPKGRTKKGPGRRSSAFYNESMRSNRDIAVLVLSTISRHGTSKLKVLDGLAATGALGLRLANEVPDLHVTLNERDEAACETIMKNIELNGLSQDDVKVENSDLNLLLHGNRFGYIDIDPYGSPVPFLDHAYNALTRRAWLGITATDKAPLCGAYPKACFRKYHGKPINTSYSDEIGLRILIGYCARTAAKHDIGIKPHVSYSFQHHFRTYLRTEEGAKRADESLKKMGYVCHDRETGERFCSEVEEKGYLNAGPLWIGGLLDQDTVSGLKSRPYTDISVRKMVELWKEEVVSHTLFYTTDEVSKMKSANPPRLRTVLDKLRSQGFTATRTHFSPTGFKTDATIEDLKKLF
jgi:tRNA (guanine26-N2/guanine27-N2)-dimethyltransferase